MVLGYFHPSIGQTNKYYNANESWTQTTVCMTMGQPWCIESNYYFINGDTLLLGDTLKKVLVLERHWIGGGFSPYQGSMTDPVYLVKEENDTVTVLSINSPDLITDSAVFYYDFNNSILYTWYYYSDGNPNYGTQNYGMNMQDSIVIGGVTRRIFYTEGPTYEGAFCNSWGPVTPITDPNLFDGWQHLQCYAGNDSIHINYSGEVWPGNADILNPPVPGNCNLDNIYWSSIDEYYDQLIDLYPNPASNELRISQPNGNGFVIGNINNSLGQPISVRKIDEDELDVSALTPGIYFLQINTGKNIFYRKFMKE